MIRKIQIPLDCSSFGEHAIPWALRIAERAGASVELVHVHPPGSETAAKLTSSGIEFYSDLLRRRAQLYLDGAAQRILESSQTEVKASMLDGDVAERIASYSEQTGTDLVVLTTHGRGAFARFWLGSVADQIVRKATVPLLLIRPRESPVSFSQECAIQHALIALDGEKLAESILPVAGEICDLCSAKTTLLQIVPPVWPEVGQFVGDLYSPQMVPSPDELKELEKQRHESSQAYLKRLAGSLRNVSGEIHTKTLTGSSPGRTILEEAEGSKGDLIAMTTHGRGGLSRFFRGSVADKVIRGASVPVLIRRPNTE